jgi:hypothetical protein
MDQKTSNCQAVKLEAFRKGFYGCLGHRRDALFEIAEAVLTCHRPVTSLPELSLEPVFSRKHGSLYGALADGGIDRAALEKLLLATSPEGWAPIFGVDISNYTRPEARTLPGLEWCHMSRSGGAVRLPGYALSFVSRLSAEDDSWTAPVSTRRFHPGKDRTAETVEQIQDLIDNLPPDSHPLFVFDAGYHSSGLAAGLAGTGAATLTRLRFDRVFFREPPPQAPGRRGRPRINGEALRTKDLARLPDPDEHLEAFDKRGNPVLVAAWHHLHMRPDRGRPRSGKPVAGSLITVEIVRPKPTSGRPVAQPLRLFWTGPGKPDLSLLWQVYLRRFDLEQTFRFWKQRLGWTVPSLETPEQIALWTALLAAVYTQLRLARSLVPDVRLPWQRPLSPEEMTPGRVHQGFSRVWANLPRLTGSPKMVKPGSGWPKGQKRQRKKPVPVFKRAP